MKAIVTGGCGFIGFNLTKKLKSLGYDIVVVDNLSTGDPNNTISGVRYIYDTITNKDMMYDLVLRFRPDVLFHLAALPRVSLSVEKPFETALENVIGTVSVLDAVRKTCKTCRVVATSSSSVYGGAENLPTSENEKCNPKSPYALEKLQLEEWCFMYAQLYNMDTVCLRYFNVFGPHSKFGGAYSTVLSAWMYHLFVDSSYAPFLEGDGQQTRDFCFVDNVVNANILSSTSEHSFKGEVFNIAQGRSYSLLYIKEELEKITNRNIILEMRPARIGDVKHTLADISKAKLMLGYNPGTNFDEQIEQMANWYKNSYSK